MNESIRSKVTTLLLGLPKEEVAELEQQLEEVRQEKPAQLLEAVIENTKALKHCLDRAMQQGVDFGTIPGCGDKFTLLLPGAQKLCRRFGLKPRYKVDSTYEENNHKTFQVKCVLVKNNRLEAEGVGECSTMESKYRYRKGDRLCPKCQKPALRKGTPERGGGWYCWNRLDGCGAKWAEGAPEIANQKPGKTEHGDPADYYNTCLKMAKKRAFVDATLSAVGAADLFSQDIGDHENYQQASKKQQQAEAQDHHEEAAPEEQADPNAPTEEIIEQWKGYLTQEARKGKAAMTKAWAVMKATPPWGAALAIKMDPMLNDLQKVSANADEALAKVKNHRVFQDKPPEEGKTTAYDPSTRNRDRF